MLVHMAHCSPCRINFTSHPALVHMKKMSSTFTVKKITLLAFFATVFVQYLILRLKLGMNRSFARPLATPVGLAHDATRAPEPVTTVNNFDRNLTTFYDRNVLDEMVRLARRKTPIYINIDASKSFFENAVTFYQTYQITFDNLADVAGFSICTDVTSLTGKCQVMDMKDFVRLYFNEISNKQSKSSILQYFNGSQCFGPRVRSNFSDDELKTLGVMIGMALATKTFINITFCKNIAIDTTYSANYDNSLKEFLGNSRDSISMLADLDSQQFTIYKAIIASKSSHSTSATKYGFITNPNSKAIFTTWNNDFRFDREGFEIISYPASAYPLALASRKLFIFPQIDEGMKEFFNKKALINTPPGYYERSKVKIDFDSIFVTSPNERINFADWKKHSTKGIEIEENSVAAMFWSELEKFNPVNIIKLYTALTGYEGLPLGGFERLPKTQVVPVQQRSRFIPDVLSVDRANFTIYIRDDTQPNEIEFQLKQIIKAYDLYRKIKQ